MDKAAKILRDKNAEIMKIWKAEVMQKVSASRQANAIALYDHLPNIINDIADIMSRYDNLVDINSDQKYNEILENSIQHGRHRSSTSNYTVEQVVHEYIIFHRTLSEFLKSHNGYNEKASDILKYVIETCVLKSVGSFTSSIQDMQEKLIGTLAHDIRNPLTVIGLSLEMIKDEDDKQWRNETLKAAQRNLKKALGLIEGLMDGITVKAGEGMMLHFEKADILNDIKWVHSESKEVYASEIILKCNKDSILGVFDSTAIRRLLENLISNAVKYGSSRKPITINVDDDKSKVTISIHNYGNYISQERQNQIFKFLEKDKSVSARKSWGMGLTLVQIVTEAHGGEIKLESSEGQGTYFTVTILKKANDPGKKRATLNQDI